MFTSRVTTAAWAPSEELQITSKLVCSRDPQGPCAGSFQRVCEDEPRTRSHARHGSHSLPLLASSLSCAWAAWGTELVQISRLQVSTRDWAAIDDDHLKKKTCLHCDRDQPSGSLRPSRVQSRTRLPAASRSETVNGSLPSGTCPYRCSFVIQVLSRIVGVPIFLAGFSITDHLFNCLSKMWLQSIVFCACT